MATMISCANAIPNFPFVLCRPNGYDVSDDLVTWYPGARQTLIEQAANHESEHTYKGLPIHPACTFWSV